MTSITDYMPDYIRQMLDAGHCIVLYSGRLDSEPGYIAITCDVPTVYDNALQSIGNTPAEALKNLVKIVITNEQDDSDIELGE